LKIHTTGNSSRKLRRFFQTTSLKPVVRPDNISALTVLI